MTFCDRVGAFVLTLLTMTSAAASLSCGDAGPAPTASAAPTTSAASSAKPPVSSAPSAAPSVSATPRPSSSASAPVANGPCKPFGAKMARASDFGHGHGKLYVPKDTASLPPALSWRRCSAGDNLNPRTTLDGCEELDATAWKGGDRDRDDVSLSVLDTGVDESPRLVGVITPTSDGWPCGMGFVTLRTSGEVASAALFEGHIEMFTMDTYEGFISFSMTVFQNADPSNPGERTDATFSGYNAAAPPFLGELGAGAESGRSALRKSRVALLRSGGKPTPLDPAQDFDFAGDHVVRRRDNTLEVAAADGAFTKVVDAGAAAILAYQANRKHIVWLEERGDEVLVRASPFATTAEGMKIADLATLPRDDKNKRSLYLGAGNALYGDFVVRLGDGTRRSLAGLGPKARAIGVTDEHVYFNEGISTCRISIANLSEPAATPATPDAVPATSASAAPSSAN